MYKRNIFLLLLFLLFQLTFSQLPRLTESSKISVLTCSAGTELYSAFGHTAFRVQDTTLGIDVVYNYGTFDPDKPNFYLNFARGKMQYSLSRKSFEQFLYEYELEKRWVKEQILDLATDERNTLFAFFEQNYLPQNRDYAYDPLFNNCSTMVIDILKNQFGDALIINDSHLPERFSFRQLIMQHLDWNSWSAFGINLCYGAVVDREATVKEHTFLPYYALYQLRNTNKGKKPILLRERTVLDYPEQQSNGFFLTTPLFWVLFILLFVTTITYLDWTHQTRNKWLDFSLFLITGLIGSLLLVLWLFTAHSGTPNNLNILWALPFNLVAAFFLLNQKMPSWMGKYLRVALGLIGLTILLWLLKVQIFSPLFLILMITMAIRYSFLLFRMTSK